MLVLVGRTPKAGVIGSNPVGRAIFFKKLRCFLHSASSAGAHLVPKRCPFSTIGHQSWNSSQFGIERKAICSWNRQSTAPAETPKATRMNLWEGQITESLSHGVAVAYSVVPPGVANYFGATYDWSSQPASESLSTKARSSSMTAGHTTPFSG